MIDVLKNIDFISVLYLNSYDYDDGFQKNQSSETTPCLSVSFFVYRYAEYAGNKILSAKLE